MINAVASNMLCCFVVIFCLVNSIEIGAERIKFEDGGVYQIDQNYPSHNIFVMSGTSLSLVNGHQITAPSDADNGEDAVRVEDASFFAKSGVIVGGKGVGGSGVTITNNRNTAYSSNAEFEEGVEVYGGDAARETTTRGGDAVQVLNDGAEASFNGGKFVPGLGCSVKACGEATSDGNSLQVMEGKAIVKGGTFTGNFYNKGGEIEIHGCVVYDGKQITGVLQDGSSIDVAYSGNKNGLSINYSESVCPSLQESPNNSYQATLLPIILPATAILGFLFVL